MSILKTIWNGPFHIGKLSQPVSVGDVLLKILEVAWRAVVATVGLAIAATAVIAGYIYVITPIFFPPLKDQIVARAFYAADLSQPPPLVSTVTPSGAPTLPTMEEIEKEPCTKAFPVRVIIVNESDSTISSVSFDLKGYAKGYSTNYIENWGYEKSESIIPPKGGWSSCYSIRTKGGMAPNRLRYKVDVWSAQEAEE